jgi:hypothetical protein
LQLSLPPHKIHFLTLDINIMKLHSIFALLAVTATLAACGGGGGDAPTPTPTPVLILASSGTDKYVGTWGNCQPVAPGASGILSARTNFVFTKTNINVMDLSVDGVGYKTTDCSGAAADAITGIGTAVVTINGAKLLGTQTVDRLDFVAKSATISSFNGNLKDLGFITGNTLLFSASSSGDANGYPTALDTTTIFTKQ